MLHLFFGHDERLAAGSHAFIQSVIEHSIAPLAITPITRIATGEFPEGSNAFTLRRFLVPWLMGYRGYAMFADGSDMLCRADLSELAALADYYSAVQVVKHNYRTRHPRKFVGTSMEAENADYERKQWASVMLINCSHFAWLKVTPEYVRSVDPMELLQFRFLPPDRIGDLPIEWNWLADEFGTNDQAKLIHFTAGIPALPAYADAPMAHEWRAASLRANTCNAIEGDQ